MLRVVGVNQNNKVVDKNEDHQDTKNAQSSRGKLQSWVIIFCFNILLLMS